MNALNINIFSVLVATVSGMLLGAFWYSPIAFGKSWMKSIGKTTDDLGSQAIPMVGSALSCFVTALAISIIMSFANINTVVDGTLVGAVIGMGIVFTALLSDNLFCGWGIKLLLIQSGYRVLYIIIMASIIAAWPK